MRTFFHGLLFVAGLCAAALVSCDRAPRPEPMVPNILPREELLDCMWNFPSQPKGDYIVTYDYGEDEYTFWKDGRIAASCTARSKD